MDQSNFIKYKETKNKFDYSYKGYNLKFIIPGYLNFVFDGDVPSSKDVFKSFINSFEIFDLKAAIKENTQVLITYLINRSDYKDLAYAAQKLYPGSEVINIESLPKKKVSVFSITYIKHFWLSLWLIFSRNIGECVASKFYLIASVIKILNLIKLAEQQKETHIGKYICFNSAYREEAVLTTYFNKRNIETVTMQHGIFCDFKIKIPFDIINHENIIAEKLLCWGQQTIDFLTKKGINPTRLLLAGNPKYNNVKINSINQSFKKCLVLLGRGYYLDTNNKLLEILTKFNKKNNNSILFYIKKHPFLDDKEHKQFASINNNMIFLGKEHTVLEILQSDLIDFSIAVNTTAYYESLALGKPCLRWVEAENEDFFGMNDKFETLSEFSERINELKEMPQDIIRDRVKEVTKYVFNPFYEMIEILDCTLRDGGYYTNWDFSDQLTNNYFAAMENLPVSYVEVGYRSLTNDSYSGEYNFCPNYLLNDIRTKLPTTKIGIIVNEKEITPNDLDRLLSFDKGTVDFVRMAVAPNNLKSAKDIASKIKKMGFEVGFNVMYMSKWESEYPAFLSEISVLEGIADSFTMVDSYGSMYPDDVKRITRILKQKLSCKLGFHGHNNIELAFANTLIAIEEGCNIIDTTITGMGRGAGNLKTELLLSYLSSEKELPVDFNSLSSTVSDFEQLREKYSWGTNLPYMVSGFGSLPQKDVMDWITRRFYSINSILRALHNMRDKKDDNIKLPVFNDEKQNFDIALVIGGGPSGANCSKPLKTLLRKYNSQKICIIHASSKNAGFYNDIDIPQFFCLVGNEGYRLEKVFSHFDVDKVTCILPPYPRKMGTYIPKPLISKSYELKDITFTNIYQDSHTALALQTAIELKVNTLYIAGYDGYEGSISENEMMLTNENEYLLGRIVKEKPDMDISTITASRYQAIKNRSVYRLLID